MARDAVCGMTVDPEGAAFTLEFEGRKYAFCSEGCRNKFARTPGDYVSGEREDGEGKAGGEGRAEKAGRYTCPMHPEVQKDGPGPCPKCGMALERQEGATEEEENPELVDMRRRFGVSLALTAPVFLIAMSEMLPGDPVQRIVSGRLLVWAQMILATPVVVWGGRPFFQRGWTSVVTRRLNMFTLIGLGTGAAYAYSLVATLAPGIFPESFRAESGEVAVYFEASAVIVTLVLLGQVLELRARSQTGAAIRELLGLAPKTARRIAEDGSEEDGTLLIEQMTVVQQEEQGPLGGIVQSLLHSTLDHVLDAVGRQSLLAALVTQPADLPRECTECALSVCGVGGNDSPAGELHAPLQLSKEPALADAGPTSDQKQRARIRGASESLADAIEGSIERF